MLNKIYIRIAEPEDAAILTQLAVATFVETFAADNTKEDMDKYVLTEMNQGKIATELADSTNTFYLASFDGNPAGFAKVRATETPAELAGNLPLEIERLYVLQQYQSHKIGAALMTKCISHAIENRFNMVWLGVWEHNQKAINFYKRWGFEFFGSHIFRLGNDEQIDMLMKKVL